MYTVTSMANFSRVKKMIKNNDRNSICDIAKYVGILLSLIIKAISNIVDSDETWIL